MFEWIDVLKLGILFLASAVLCYFLIFALIRVTIVTVLASTISFIKTFNEGEYSGEKGRAQKNKTEYTN